MRDFCASNFLAAAERSEAALCSLYSRGVRIEGRPRRGRAPRRGADDPVRQTNPICGGRSATAGRAIAPNEPNWPGSRRPREIRSTKPEIRDKLEMQMTETDQSAPNEPNLRRFWAKNEGGRGNEAKFRTGRGGRSREVGGRFCCRECQTNPICGKGGRRNAGRLAGAPVAGEGGPRMTNKANLVRWRLAIADCRRAECERKPISERSEST